MNEMKTPSYNAFPPLVKPEWRNSVVAIGNFDGVHRGHQALLQHGRRTADQAGCAFIVLTFDPHPRRFFQPQSAPFLITQRALKEALLQAHGADGIVTLPFNEVLSRLSANEFIKQVLEDRLAAKHIVVGQNFVFGYGRQGHVDTLSAHGFDVTALTPVARDDGLIYSSSAVREAIAAGDIAEANLILGRAWNLTGTIVKGHQRGKTIGFPTANLLWPDDILVPAFGVYAVTCILADGGLVKGVANFGVRPTFADFAPQPLLEIHLFDFDRDIYEQELDIQFHRFIRAEQKFETLGDLTSQIRRDCLIAKQTLA